jgi:hypothetical protein
LSGVELHRLGEWQDQHWQPIFVLNLNAAAEADPALSRLLN